MAQQNQSDPQVVTIRGRLSWPRFTYAEALEQNAKSSFPKKESDVRPNFNLLLDDVQAEKLITHLREVFLPWCVEQSKAGDKAKSALTEKQAKNILETLEAADWEEDNVVGLIYPVHEQTAELAPEAVMSVRVNGFKGQDLPLKAVVRSESELKNPTDDIIIPERGLILPVNDTVHELYPGSRVASTINLFAFVSNKTPGISASTGAAIFVGDAERFGGGGFIDEDEVFMDLDD